MRAERAHQLGRRPARALEPGQRLERLEVARVERERALVGALRVVAPLARADRAPRCGAGSAPGLRARARVEHLERRAQLGLAAERLVDARQRAQRVRLLGRQHHPALHPGQRAVGRAARDVDRLDLAHELRRAGCGRWCCAPRARAPRAATARGAGAAAGALSRLVRSRATSSATPGAVGSACERGLVRVERGLGVEEALLVSGAEARQPAGAALGRPRPARPDAPAMSASSAGRSSASSASASDSSTLASSGARSAARCRCGERARGLAARELQASRPRAAARRGDLARRAARGRARAASRWFDAVALAAARARPAPRRSGRCAGASARPASSQRRAAARRVQLLELEPAERAGELGALARRRRSPPARRRSTAASSSQSPRRRASASSAFKMSVRVGSLTKARRQAAKASSGFAERTAPAAAPARRRPRRASRRPGAGARAAPTARGLGVLAAPLALARLDRPGRARPGRSPRSPMRLRPDRVIPLTPHRPDRRRLDAATRSRIEAHRGRFRPADLRAAESPRAQGSGHRDRER